MLVADDDGYDAHGLEALGYGVTVVDSPEAAREGLKEGPAIFLCDHNWNGDGSVGRELAREGVQVGIFVVLLISVGAIPKPLPPGVGGCVGWNVKSDAARIHRRIVQTWYRKKPA